METGQILALIAIVAAIMLVTCITSRCERRFRRELAQRGPLDDDQFFQAFYARSEVEPDIPRRLRPIYCQFFDMDVTKLRPLDRPPEICEIDTSELVHYVEAEFGTTISDKDAEQIDGSFDSIVRYIARQRATAHVRES